MENIIFKVVGSEGYAYLRLLFSCFKVLVCHFKKIIITLNVLRPSSFLARELRIRSSERKRCIDVA